MSESTERNTFIDAIILNISAGVMHHKLTIQPKIKLKADVKYLDFVLYHSSYVKGVKFKMVK
jgi:hypothetical protein